MKTAEKDNCLVGSLADWPLSELIVWLHRSGKTAMLRVGAGLDAGVIFFRDGYLFRCEWGGAQGERALIGLLQCQQGDFVLIQRDIPDVRANVMKATAELLLQCTVSMDEAHRARLS